MKKIIVYLILCLPLLAIAQTKSLTKEDYIARVKANPDSISSLIDLRRVGGYTPEYAELHRLYQTLGKKVKSSEEGKEFETYLEALSAVTIGKQAPLFSQPDTSGNLVNLSDFKGKYLLLDFWASWCPDCRVESPNLVKTYALFKDKNFEILGISFDKDRKSWINAIHMDKLHWRHISDLKRWQNDVGTLYGVKSIPQNILIDPTGKIIARNLHGEDLNNKLKEVLK